MSEKLDVGTRVYYYGGGVGAGMFAFGSVQKLLFEIPPLAEAVTGFVICILTLAYGAVVFYESDSP